MAVTAAFYPPVAPVFLLTCGRDSTVLKGTEVTAYTKRDTSVEAEDLTVAKQSGSGLPEMIRFLTRVLNGEGSEGDMPNLIFMAEEDDLQGALARAGLAKGRNRKGGPSENRPIVKSEFCQIPPNKLQLTNSILLV
jgi:hypothetical protein